MAIPFTADQLYAGIVYDTLRTLGLRDEDMLLSSRIRPLNNTSWCYGRAFTNKGRVVNAGEDYAHLDAIRLEMYAAIKPGDVVVLQADDTSVAHAGDITCLIYEKLGASGFITDGIVRDSRRIVAAGFPCFCAATNPIDALNYWAITEYMKPIQLPGLHRKITIEAGDVLYADNDGVLCIPAAMLPAFEEQVGELVQREEECRKRFRAIERAGQVFEEVESAFRQYGRW